MIFYNRTVNFTANAECSKESVMIEAVKCNCCSVEFEHEWYCDDASEFVRDDFQESKKHLLTMGFPPRNLMFSLLYVNCHIAWFWSRDVKLKSVNKSKRRKRSQWTLPFCILAPTGANMQTESANFFIANSVWVWDYIRNCFVWLYLRYRRLAVSVSECSVLSESHFYLFFHCFSSLIPIGIDLYLCLHSIHCKHFSHNRQNDLSDSNGWSGHNKHAYAGSNDHGATRQCGWTKA